MGSGPITSWQIEREEVASGTDFIFLGSKITADNDCSHKIKRCFLRRRKAMTKLDSILKSRDINLPVNVHIVKAVVLSIVRYGCEELDHKEGWPPKNGHFQIVVLEKTLESPSASKEIKLANAKGNQLNIYWKDWCWMKHKLESRFLGEISITSDMHMTPPLWQKSWLIWKDPDTGKDWGQEKGTTEEKMVGWHHRLNGHGFG